MINLSKLRTQLEHILMRFNYIDPNNDYVDVLDYRFIPIVHNADHAKRMEEAPEMELKSGGRVSSASKRADGIAERGKTRGTMVAMCGGGYTKRK